MAPIQDPFKNLPEEISLRILTYLGFKELLRLRQTCRHLRVLTLDASLWARLVEEQRDTLNIPFLSDLHALLRQQPLNAFPLTNVPEDHFRHLQETAFQWVTPVNQYAAKLPQYAKTLLGFEVFLDRYLLSVYGEGVLQLWDIDPEKATQPKPSEAQLAKQLLSHNIGGLDGRLIWKNFCARIDTSLRHIIVAINGGIFRLSLRSLFRIELPVGEDSWPTLSSIDLPVGMTQLADNEDRSDFARTVDPGLRVVVFTGTITNTVNILPYEQHPDPCVKLPDVTEIDAQTGLLDGAWNGIILCRVIGPYLALFRLRSVEFQPIAAKIDCRGHPDNASCPHFYPRGLPILQHQFPEGTFRQIAISEPEIRTQIPNSGDATRIIQFTSLHADPVKGLLRNELAIKFLPRGDGSYHATLDVVQVGVLGLESFDTPDQESTTTDLPITRNFIISAIALGGQGKRAVWIERSRGHTTRDVLVWSKGISSGCREHTKQEERGKMDGRIKYKHLSYDLREDLILCSVMESSGYIILGNRAGETYILR